MARNPLRPGILLALALGLVLLLGPVLQRTVLPWLYFGGPLLALDSPLPGAQLPVGAVQLEVRFADAERAFPDSFRCVFNGVDVTDSLHVAHSGAAGALFALQEGSNTLRVEISGRTLWGERPRSQSLEIEFQTRVVTPPERAAAPAPADPGIA